MYLLRTELKGKLTEKPRNILLGCNPVVPNTAPRNPLTPTKICPWSYLFKNDVLFSHFHNQKIQMERVLLNKNEHIYFV